MKLALLLFIIFNTVLSTWGADTPLQESKSLKSEYGLSLQAIYYFDDRDYNTLSITTAALKLPYNFSFWGFTDFHGNQTSPRNRLRHTRSFSEYRLTYDLKELTGLEGLGLQAEYNFSSTSDKHTTRVGPVFKHSIPFLRKGSWLQWRLFPIQTDDNLQVSVIYKFLLSEKWSISGFADLNLNSGQRDRWIVEPQLNYQFNKYISLHFEYRYNGFEDANKSLRGNGFAIGMGINF
jgi:predicted porin